MKKTAALVFGKNEYSKEIVTSISHEYSEVFVFALLDGQTESGSQEEEGDFFTLSDEWQSLEKRFDMENSIAFCALENDAQNIFLTISLRSTFKKLSIIALAKNKESANKLKMAGASKVIPRVETTADIIVDMLEKPIVTEVLNNMLYEKSDLKIVQIKVSDDNFFHGKYPSDIEWSRDHGVLVLSIMDEEMNSEFIYSSQAKHHPIKNGDIFVVVGYERDIKEFQKLIRSEN